MPRYKSKPREIEAVQFKNGGVILPAKTEGVRIEFESNLRRWEVWNHLHGSWIGFKDGDYLRIDNAPDDVYPIDEATFNESYELIEEEMDA